MKILHVIWGLTPGGAERQLISMVKAQQKWADPMVCCLEQGGSFANELTSSGIKVEVLNKLPGFDLKALIKLVKIMQGANIDLVHSHIWSANLWSRIAAVIARVPLKIIHEHSTFSLEKRTRKLIDFLLAPFTDTIICVSAEIAQGVRHQEKICREKILLIRNGIETHKFSGLAQHRSKFLKQHLAAGNQPRIIIVGALEPRKDHLTFIKSANELLKSDKQLEFAIVGTGPLAEQLKKTVFELGLEKQIKFLGLRNDIAELLAESSVYVSTSITEGISIALLEAMAVAVPVVATEVGGTVEVDPEHKFLHLVPSRNHQAIASTVRSILDNPQASQAKADCAYATIATRFSAANMNRRIKGLYLTLNANKKIPVSKKIKSLPKRLTRWCLSRMPTIISSTQKLQLPANTLRILMYHRIRDGFPDDRLSVNTVSLTRQLMFLREAKIPLFSLTRGLQSLSRKELPQGGVVFTFDDGYAETLRNALPIFAEFNTLATFYLPAGLIENKTMIKRYRHEPQAGRLLSWAEARQLCEAGWEAGCHTLNHADLSKTKAKQLDQEIIVSKKMLEDKLNQQINSFSYPQGKLSAAAMKMVEKAGYLNAVTVWPGENSKDSNPFTLSRTEISGDDNLNDFICKLRGGFDFYQSLRQRNTVCNPELIP